MKLSRSIYVDSHNNEWVVQKHSLPKKKGEYVYWIADCVDLCKSIKADKKRDIISKIKNNENL